MAGSLSEMRRNRLSTGTVAAALVVLWLTAAGVCGRVQKQVVMFHQYPVRVDVDLEARTAVVSPPDNIPGLGKSRTFYDYNTRVIAYKDFRAKQCHLERMSEDEKLPGTEEESVERREEVQEGSEEREAERRLHRQLGLLGSTQHNRNRQKRAPQSKVTPAMRRRPKTLFVTETVLTKYEVLRLAGRRISHFCRGFPATLLVQRPPNPPPQLQSPAKIPWLAENELPGEGESDTEEHRLLLEAALVKARLAELELQTLDSSEEDAYEGHRATNKASRSKRQAQGGGTGNGWYNNNNWPRKFRGQTQSQFVSFGGEGKGEGTAQAESRPEGSTTLVRGVNGMGQSQSQSSAGDGCEGCYPGGYTSGGYPGAQYGPWQQPGYGTAGRIAPGAIVGQTGVDGMSGGRGAGVGTTGTRGYGPGTQGYGRPAAGTSGVPGYDGTTGIAPGQTGHGRPGSLAQRPGAGGPGGPGFGGVTGVIPGRGLGGVRGYGTDGIVGSTQMHGGPAGTGPGGQGYGGPGRDVDQGYIRPSTTSGQRGTAGVAPTGPGYLGPVGVGTGYGVQPGGAVRTPGYRGPGGVNGHVGPTGGGAVPRPQNGVYTGRPGYGVPAGVSHMGGPGYGHVPGISQRPSGPSGPSGLVSPEVHVPGDGGQRGHGGVIQPGSHVGHPSASGHQITDGRGGIPNGHGLQVPGQYLKPGVQDGQHLGPGMAQRPHGGTHDYGAPGYGAHHPVGEGDGRHTVGGGNGRVPGRTTDADIYGSTPGGRVPTAHGGQTASPGAGMLPSGHGVSGHGIYGPGTGHGAQIHGTPGGQAGHVTGNRYGGYPDGGGPGTVPGRGVHDGRGHHVPSGSGGVVRGPGTNGMGVSYPGGAHRPSSHLGPQGIGTGGYPSQVGGYDRYPSGIAGHGLHGGVTGPGGDGRFRGHGTHTPEASIPDHLAPENIRGQGGVLNGRYPDGSAGAMHPGQVSPGVGATPTNGQSIGGAQRPDGTLGAASQYGRPGGDGLGRPYQYPGGPGYAGGQRGQGEIPGYGAGIDSSGYRQPGDGQTQYGRPGYYDGQGAYPLTRPGAGGRGQAGVADAGESQAQTSVTQDEKEIKAGASSQGRLGDGKAQAQVSGTYSGTGSFSAQAQTSDGGRSAQSQVTGNKDGGSSSAQGNGGSGQSQSQVQLSSTNGATKAEAQSGGRQHGSNTQVQAGENGGMADAQSSGPGTTSSQAQVGFKPYRANGNVQRTPFRGGGTASAQSSSFTGQSQSQVQGAYRYGVSFTGAAQAGSGVRGSRGASDGAAKNGTQRFERDDHAALNPDSFKLTPLKNFRDIATPNQMTTQEGIKSPDSINGQMDVNKGIRHRATNGHSSMLGSHQQTPSNIPQMGQQGTNGHTQFNSNNHGMQGSHLQHSLNVPEIGHQTPKGHLQFSGNIPGRQGSHLDGASSGHQMGHNSHNTMTQQNSKVTPQGLETSTDLTSDGMTGHRSSKPGQLGNGNRQPENEYPNYGNNMMTSGGPNMPHGSMQGGEYPGETSASGGMPTVFKTEEPRQSQAVFLSPMATEDVHITQASDGGGIPAQTVYQPGQIVPGSSGYVIPEGFRGRVVGDSRSIAGDETLAIASPNNGNSQSQTVVLTPGSGKVNYTRIVRPPHGQPVVPVYEDYGQNQGMDDENEPPTRRNGYSTRSYMGSEVYSRGDQHVYSRNKIHTRSGGKAMPPSSHKVEEEYDEEEDEDIEEEEEDGTENEEVNRPSSPTPLPNSYVSVTKSVSGQLNPINVPQGSNGRQFVNGNRGLVTGTDGGKFAHTYYTKSSTCGYFTFSCNVVFGSNGRAKICKPRPPTNPDGSPCCC